MPRRGAEARRAVAALRFTRGCDVVLELGLVAFAGWTLLYHACLLAGAGADVAAGLSLALGPIGWWTLRSGLRAGEATGPEAPVDARGTSVPTADGSVRSRALLPAAAAALA